LIDRSSIEVFALLDITTLHISGQRAGIADLARYKSEACFRNRKSTYSGGWNPL